MEEECKLGDVEFEWEPGHPLMTMLDGHGVGVFGTSGDDVGVIDRASSSIIDSSGGMFVARGDRVLHNQEYCAEGRRQAAS